MYFEASHSSTTIFAWCYILWQSIYTVVAHSNLTMWSCSQCKCCHLGGKEVTPRRSFLMNEHSKGNWQGSRMGTSSLHFTLIQRHRHLPYNRILASWGKDQGNSGLHKWHTWEGTKVTDQVHFENGLFAFLNLHLASARRNGKNQITFLAKKKKSNNFQIVI